MIRKRIAFGVLTLAAVAATLFSAKPAEARYRRYGGSSFSISISSGRSYGGGYYGGYRDYCGPRYRRVYRPVRRVRYVDYGYDYAPRYRRYRCGCGRSFASAYWLDYHHDHADCY